MADLTPEQQQEQYAAIELLYSEGRWSEVLQASEALLAVLPPVQGHPLRPRLELVIGHTLLYGLADLDGAEARYRAVLVDTEEPVLREIAEQGLSRCSEQRQELALAAESSQAPETASEEQPMAEGPSAEALIGENPLEAEVPFAAGIGAPAAIAGTETNAGAPGLAAMPWELNSAAPAGSGIQGVQATGAAMPWLTELGTEDHSSEEAPPAVEDMPFSSSVRPVRNIETTDLKELVAEALTEQPASADESLPTPESTTAQETLAQLREPDDLIPVTVQVLEEPQPQAEAPEPPKEEPPLSPEEMTELARGLLEVVLR